MDMSGICTLDAIMVEVEVLFGPTTTEGTIAPFWCKFIKSKSLLLPPLWSRNEVGRDEFRVVVVVAVAVADNDDDPKAEDPVALP